MKVDIEKPRNRVVTITMSEEEASSLGWTLCHAIGHCRDVQKPEQIFNMSGVVKKLTIFQESLEQAYRCGTSNEVDLLERKNER